MNSADFWASITSIIDDGFTPKGLHQLDLYAEQFISGRLVYQRFSPFEQHGCITGGSTHVIASLLAAAKTGTDQATQCEFTDFKEELKCAAQQAQCIEHWARITGCWTDNVVESLSHSLGEQIAEGGEAIVFDHGSSLIKSIGLDYYVQPILALDRITLHNAYFPATRLHVLGFGRDHHGEFKIVVEQPFIIGHHLSDDHIAQYMAMMGFELKNPRNWTYSTPEIYLSDLHDENVIQSDDGNIFVVDCDIRINTPSLKQGGIRKYLRSVVTIPSESEEFSNLVKEPIVAYGREEMKKTILSQIALLDDPSALKQILDLLTLL